MAIGDGVIKSDYFFFSAKKRKELSLGAKLLLL